MALVVGVEQDDVGLDAHVAELADAFFQMVEERRIEPREVPLAPGGVPSNGYSAGSFSFQA